MLVPLSKKACVLKGAPMPVVCQCVPAGVGMSCSVGQAMQREPKEEKKRQCQQVQSETNEDHFDERKKKHTI